MDSQATQTAPSAPLTPAELHRMLVAWNDTARDTPAEALTDLFQRHAGQDPGRIAVIDGARRVSYGDLNARVNRLARHLTGLGIGPENVVAIALPRGVEVVAAKLAVLKAGAAYLPIDPAYPADRIAYMISDARPARVLTDTVVAAILPATAPLMVL